MSVYSGFATRQQETFYNKLLDRMIQLITLKLLHSLKKIDELLIAQVPGGTQDPTTQGPQNQTAAFESERQNFLNKTTSQENSSSKKVHSISPEGDRSGSGLAMMAGILKGNDQDRKWIQYIKKIYSAIHNMEKQKYLEPKFSQAIVPLIKYLQKKHVGVGSAMTNISLISHSQREGEPMRAVNSSLLGLMSNFNDTFSLGSLLSGQPEQNQLGFQRSSLENEMLSTAKSRGPHLLVDDQKHASLISGGGGVVPRASNECVLEQTIEEDKDDGTQDGRQRRRKSSTLIIENLRPREQAQSQNEKYVVMGAQGVSPVMVDSLIIGKQTSRNLGGPHLPDTIVGGGIGSTDSGSGLVSNPQILHYTQNSILSENSTIYRDYGYNNIVRGQKSTPRQNTSKKRNSRSINCSSTSQNKSIQNRTNTSLLETAYKTSYPQVQSQIIHGVAAYGNSDNQQQLKPAQSNYGQKDPKKSSRLIRTLIDRQNEKHTQINNTRNFEASSNMNTDMQHFKLTNMIPDFNNSKTYEQLQPSQVAIQSYFNNNRAMSHHGPGQAKNADMSRLDFLQPNLSPNQYSAITVKFEGQPPKNDYMCHDLDKQRQKQSTGYMKQRQQKQFKFVSEKKQAKSKGTAASRQDQMAQVFEDVYNTGVPPINDQIARINRQQTQDSQRVAEYQSDNGSQRGPLSQAHSHRSLQKNYLQNLGELVKIHQEMKRGFNIQIPLRKTQY